MTGRRHANTQQGIPNGPVKKDARPDGEGDELIYRFGEEEWTVAKEKLKSGGKWYLD